MTAQGEVLVSGSNSGLGKHCAEYFNSACYTRDTNYAELLDKAHRKPFDIIIHAAFNTRPEVSQSQLYAYLQDTLLLTQKLLQLPHKKFIFISSVDVYPKNLHVHSEEEEINLHEVSNIYGVSKLMSESLVLADSADNLILRPTALLGKYAKKNSLMKILTLDNPTLSLAAQSTFNYVLHDDVTRFIDRALRDNLSGIYNVAAASNVALRDVCKEFNRTAQFGNFNYVTGLVSNKKISAVMDDFKQSSLEKIKLFIENMPVIPA